MLHRVCGTKETTGGGYFAVLPGVNSKDSYLGKTLFG